MRAACKIRYGVSEEELQVLTPLDLELYAREYAESRRLVDVHAAIISKLLYDVKRIAAVMCGADASNLPDVEVDDLRLAELTPHESEVREEMRRKKADQVTASEQIAAANRAKAERNMIVLAGLRHKVAQEAKEAKETRKVVRE